MVVEALLALAETRAGVHEARLDLSGGRNGGSRGMGESPASHDGTALRAVFDGGSGAQAQVVVFHENTGRRAEAAVEDVIISVYAYEGAGVVVCVRQGIVDPIFRWADPAARRIGRLLGLDGRPKSHQRAEDSGNC